MFGKITKLAIFSRVMVLVLQFLANALFNDHEPDVFRKPIEDINNHTSFINKAVVFLFGGLKHWDGEYFLHIAEHGYSYENTLAFYPVFPVAVRLVAKFLHYFGLGITLNNWMLLVAVGLNLYFFCLAANKLYELTNYMFDDLYRSWNSVLLFCINPASIFFSAAYSEALFCWLTFSLMLECLKQNRFLRTTGLLALSMLTRSNGLTNIGFIVYFTIYKILVKVGQPVLQIFKLLCVVLLAFIPLTFFNFYAYQQYCVPSHTTNHPPHVAEYGNKRGYVLAGDESKVLSPWCNYSFPMPYSYIQSHYWNVGFLRYYEWKQIPNFLIAFPILMFLLKNNSKFLKHVYAKFLKHLSISNLIKENRMIPFVIHSLLLTIFCTFFVHIQISTRLLCSASPCLYWYVASYLPQTFDQIKVKSMAFCLFLWFGSYYLLGTIMFANNLPWT